MSIQSVICKASKSSSVILLATISAFTFLDVVLRYFFSKPIIGSNEVVELMMAGLISSGIVTATKEKSHIAVSIFESKFSSGVKVVVDAIINLVNFIVFLFVTYCIFRMVKQQVELGRSSELLGIPFWLYSGLVMFFLALTTLICLFSLFRVEADK